MNTERLDVEELFFNILAITAALLTVYGFISQTGWKIVTIPLGLIALGAYIRWYIKKFITKKVLIQNKRIRKLKEAMNQELKRVKEELSYMKGWMTAINHFKGKKGKAIDPITLVIGIIIVVLVILYLQGKLS